MGAPLGTYPGGLQGLPALNPVPVTGLVYQCPVNAPGNCAGINSSTNDDNARRMFDGDRRFSAHNMHIICSRDTQCALH